MALTDQQLAVIQKARFYITDIADCTCDTDTGNNCWYYLTPVQKAKEAVDYAVRKLKVEEENRLAQIQNYLDTPGRPIFIEKEGTDGTQTTSSDSPPGAP